MSNYDKIIHISSSIERAELEKDDSVQRGAKHYIALAICTCGVGYAPLIPGSLGSALAVGIYLLVAFMETNLTVKLMHRGFRIEEISAWLHAVNLLVFLCFSLLGIWAAGVCVKIFKDKDPKQAVIDEVIGQLITFLFIPFTFSWKIVLAGFIFFRIFDIWKPYPINSLQFLPLGIGVCADDILAGIYAGIALSIFYAFML
jgi:phosphatidylglycerophosphatase A